MTKIEFLPTKISAHTVNTILSRQVMRKLRDYKLTQSQSILRTNIIRIVWQIVGRIHVHIQFNRDIQEEFNPSTLWIQISLLCTSCLLNISYDFSSANLLSNQTISPWFTYTVRRNYLHVFRAGV